MAGAPNFKAPPRVIADTLDWEQLRRAKLGPCRVCGSTWLPQLHHLVPRGRAGAAGGDDLAWNLVPLCRDCHGDVEARDFVARHRLAQSLTDGEVGYIVGKRGLEWLSIHYPLRVS